MQQPLARQVLMMLAQWNPLMLPTRGSSPLESRATARLLLPARPHTPTTTIQPLACLPILLGGPGVRHHHHHLESSSAKIFGTACSYSNSSLWRAVGKATANLYGLTCPWRFNEPLAVFCFSQVVFFAGSSLATKRRAPFARRDFAVRSRGVCSGRK